jgi:predicted transcriptional regulator
MRNMHENSLVKYKEIKPELRKWQKIVLDCVVKYGEITSKDVAFKLNVQLHKISGRFTELKAKGKIIEIGRRDGYAIFKPTPEPIKLEPGIQSRMNF